MANKRENSLRHALFPCSFITLGKEDSGEEEEWVLKEIIKSGDRVLKVTQFFNVEGKLVFEHICDIRTLEDFGLTVHDKGEYERYMRFRHEGKMFMKPKK